MPSYTSLRIQSCILHVLKTIIPTTRSGDRIVQYIYFCMRHGRRPSAKPGFNDELHRIKSTDDILRPERTYTSCKYLVKDYISARVGRKYAAPTLAVLRTDAEIDAFSFPDQCCIKSTHGSGHVVTRSNGEDFDISKVKSWLKVNYYYSSREANYRYLTPGVIVEPLLFNDGELKDYKVFCVDGVPKMIQVDCDRHTNHSRALYDMDWKFLDFGLKRPRYYGHIPRPKTLENMAEVAAQLSKPFHFVRIDFYTDNESCIVGEVTHLHGSTGEWFHSAECEQTANRILFGVPSYGN